MIIGLLNLFVQKQVRLCNNICGGDVECLMFSRKSFIERIRLHLARSD